MILCCDRKTHFTVVNAYVTGVIEGNIITGPPTHSVGGQTSNGRWRLLSSSVTHMQRNSPRGSTWRWASTVTTLRSTPSIQCYDRIFFDFHSFKRPLYLHPRPCPWYNLFLCRKGTLISQPTNQPTTYLLKLFTLSCLAMNILVT